LPFFNLGFVICTYGSHKASVPNVDSTAAFTVLAKRHATVQGPTPPGTGVRNPATSLTDGLTSPTIFGDPFSLGTLNRNYRSCFM